VEVLDFSKLKTISINKRSSKVDKTLLARPYLRGGSLKSFLDSLPNILKSKDLREIVAAVIAAKKKQKPVLLMMGAHVIKCGLSPILIDLIERGFVSALATNGAGMIHDFEMAYFGATSEDVAQNIEDGTFGMVRETADFINAAVKTGVQEGRGYGASVGAAMERARLRYRDVSIAHACFKKHIPLTVHVALGTDIIHQHPSFNGAETGEASARDFKSLCQTVVRLNDGGVVLHFGSAVLMPEVFLKALSVARNLTGKVKNFTTANFDMYLHYRPQQNIVLRPTRVSGRGYSFVGHHEIMLPLLAAALVERAGR
jgi:hypothetical protein